MSTRNAAIKGPNTSIIRVSEGTSNTSEMILEPSEQAKEANRTNRCLAMILFEMEDEAIPHCGLVMRRRTLNQTALTGGCSAQQVMSW